MTRYIRILGYGVGAVVLWVVNRFDSPGDLVDPSWVRHGGLVKAPGKPTTTEVIE